MLIIALSDCMHRNIQRGNKSLNTVNNVYIDMDDNFLLKLCGNDPNHPIRKINKIK